MWDKTEFLKTSDPPYVRVRVAGSRKEPLPQLDRIQRIPKAAPQKVTVRERLEAVAESMLDTPIPSTVEEMPFQGTSRLVGLKVLEDYLSSQLVQVRKAIEKEKQVQLENQYKEVQENGNEV